MGRQGLLARCVSTKLSVSGSMQGSAALTRSCHPWAAAQQALWLLHAPSRPWLAVDEGQTAGSLAWFMGGLCFPGHPSDLQGAAGGSHVLSSAGGSTGCSGPRRHRSQHC